jgi:hypothetical protein
MIGKIIDNNLDLYDEVRAKQLYEANLSARKCDDNALQSITDEQELAAAKTRRAELDAQYQAEVEAHSDYLPVEDPGVPDYASTSRLELAWKVTKKKIVLQYKEVAYDKTAVKSQIAKLTDELASSDYKIAKTNEARLEDPTGASDPYDTKALLAERKALREQINELESHLPAEDDDDATPVFVDMQPVKQ